MCRLAEMKMKIVKRFEDFFFFIFNRYFVSFRLFIFFCF